MTFMEAPRLFMIVQQSTWKTLLKNYFFRRGLWYQPQPTLPLGDPPPSRARGGRRCWGSYLAGFSPFPLSLLLLLLRARGEPTQPRIGTIRCHWHFTRFLWVSSQGSVLWNSAFFCTDRRGLKHGYTMQVHSQKLLMLVQKRFLMERFPMECGGLPTL